MPERSFFYRGRQFPVCARCTGVLLGQTVSAATVLTGWSAPPALGALLMIPAGVDWALQYAGIRESTNARRFVTGILAGVGYVALLVGGVRALRAARRKEHRKANYGV